MMNFVSELYSYVWPLWIANLTLNAYGFLKMNSRVLRAYDRPLDFGKLFWDGRRVLGSSTTFGGLLVTVFCVTVLSTLFPLHPFIQLACVAAFIGHAVASFIKRRCGITEGGYVAFLAHGDYIIMFALLLALSNIPAIPWSLLLAAYFVTILGTPLITYTSHKFGLRKDPL